MNSAPLTPSSPSAEEANRLHGEIADTARQMLHKAVKLGSLLSEIRESLPHGKWLPWAERNLRFSDRTARNYIKLFERQADLRLESVSNLTDAYKLLAENSADCFGRVGSNAEVSICYVLSRWPGRFFWSMWTVLKDDPKNTLGTWRSPVSLDVCQALTEREYPKHADLTWQLVKTDAKDRPPFDELYSPDVVQAGGILA